MKGIIEEENLYQRFPDDTQGRRSQIRELYADKQLAPKQHQQKQRRAKLGREGEIETLEENDAQRELAYMEMITKLPRGKKGGPASDEMSIPSDKEYADSTSWSNHMPSADQRRLSARRAYSKPSPKFNHTSNSL